MRKITLISLSVLAFALLAFAPDAFAGSDKGREVIKRGKCSGSSTWKLALAGGETCTGSLSF